MPNRSRIGNIRIVTRPANIAEMPVGQFLMQPAYINVKIQQIPKYIPQQTIGVRHIMKGMKIIAIIDTAILQHIELFSSGQQTYHASCTSAFVIQLQQNSSMHSGHFINLPVSMQVFSTLALQLGHCLIFDLQHISQQAFLWNFAISFWFKWRNCSTILNYRSVRTSLIQVSMRSSCSQMHLNLSLILAFFCIPLFACAITCFCIHSEQQMH